MININFYLAVSLSMLIPISAILIIWIFTQKQKGRDLAPDPKFIWFCSVCTYTYIYTRDEAISICPRCGSYNKREVRA